MARSALPDIGEPVQFPPLKEFSQSGIYFLWDDGVIVYVGQAVDVRRRIGTHMTESSKVFDAVSIVPCPVEDLTRIERRYIGRLVPKYNRCVIAEQARNRHGDRRHTSLKASNHGRFVQPNEAARFLGVDATELEDWRSKGIGPALRFHSDGRIKGYVPGDLADYRRLAMGG